MIWIALIVCIAGALTSLALLTIDFEKAWDLAETLKRIKRDVEDP